MPGEVAPKLTKPNPIRLDEAITPTMAALREIKPLTGLRGAAALYVMGFHYTHGLGFSNHFETLMSHGYLAVDLFFCLSGFVMALTYGEMFSSRLTADVYLTFLGRRISRIYPLYLVTTLAAFALAIFGMLQTTAPTGRTLALNVAMLQSWGFAESLNKPAWSLSAEWAAYLIFPLLLTPTLRWRPIHACAVGAGCIALIALLPALQTLLGLTSSPPSLLDIYEPWAALPVLRCLPEFVLGILAFRISLTPSGIAFAESRYGALAVLFATVLLMTMVDTDVAVIAMFAVSLVALSSERNVAAKWLSSFPAQLAGRLSYSIYLTHLLFMGWVAWVHARIHSIGLSHAHTYASAAGIAATLATSSLLYAYVEMPSRRLLRHLFEGRKTASITREFTEGLPQKSPN